MAVHFTQTISTIPPPAPDITRLPAAVSANRRRHHDSPPSASHSAYNEDQTILVPAAMQRGIGCTSTYPSRVLLILSAMAILSPGFVSSAFQPSQSSTNTYYGGRSRQNTYVEQQRQRKRATYTLNSDSGLSPDIATTTHRRATGALHAVRKHQVAVLDGAELHSVESFLAAENGSNEMPIRSGLARLGFLTVVAGSIDGGADNSGQRVVGVEKTGSGNAESDEDSSTSLGDGVFLYSDSIAIIPTGISDTDAIATMMASLSAVHCALPISENVGGSTDATISGKAVVVGGGEYATFAADALATLGAEVYQISTGKPKPGNANVKVLAPCIGPDDTGFSEYIDTFDCLVDTLAEEPPSVITELSRQHNCERYVSTYSKSQQIIRDKGILFGRDVAKKYVVDAATNSLLGGDTNQNVNILPPKGFGSNTVQKLLDAGVIYRPRDQKMTNRDVFVREWSLKDFWEFTSWPRDADGEGNTRYGLPVLDTEDFDLVYAMSLAEDEANAAAANGGDGGDEESIPSLRRVAPGLSRGAADNPYVLDVNGVEGLNRQIVGPRKHAVLFCSASWCRTCRSLKPKYIKIAREASAVLEERRTPTTSDSEVKEGEITFAQADTTGTNGKLLSRYLDVEAVPAFVLFKSGKLYGEPLSISRLPSKKLNLALQMLQSGQEYDAKAIEALDR